MRHRNSLLAVSITIIGSGIVGLFTYTQNTLPTIVINEIGAYQASDHEWIEIINVGTVPIDMTGWTFVEDDTHHGLTVFKGADAVIDPGEIAIIAEKADVFLVDYPTVTNTIFDSFWGNLNESGELIGLADANKTIIEQFVYATAPNTSLERLSATSAVYTNENWKEHPQSNSAGKSNYWTETQPAPIIESANQLPIASFMTSSTAIVSTSIFFDARASIDPDGDIISYNWNFGDGTLGSGSTTAHVYTASGTLDVTLTVTDNMNGNASISQALAILDDALIATSSMTSSSLFAPFIKINEVMPDPATGTEWIELYSLSTSTINLTDWTLSDSIGTIATISGAISPLGFLVVEIQTNKLNNTGDSIVLRTLDTTLADQIAFGDHNDGNIVDNAPKTTKGNTLARNIDGIDSNTDKSDFLETTTPTKGTANIITLPPPPPSPPPPSNNSGGSGGGGSPPPSSFISGAIVINELVSDPADDGEEFVELYNTTASTIDLFGWAIEDGAKTKTSLSGSITPKGFLVVHEPKGNLNNAGDLLVLFDGIGKEIDRMSYGNWNDGNLNDNAPLARDPLSLARLVDGKDSGNDAVDFALTTTITKGKTNSIVPPTPTSTTETGKVLGVKIITGSIRINELFPNPAGPDTEKEFIELANTTSSTIDLSFWKLEDTVTTFTFGEHQKIPAYDFLVLKRGATFIALNNNGEETIRLLSPDGTLVDAITYEDPVEEGASFSRVNTTDWKWSKTPTPGKKNVMKKLSPITKPDPSPVGGSPPIEFLQKMIISEVFPNPVGEDTEEFIELYNPTPYPIDLSGFILGDQSKSNRYTIPDGTILEGMLYMVFARRDTKIALNNDADGVRLLSPDGVVILAMTYDHAKEGYTFVPGENGIWTLSGKPTPGKQNTTIAFASEEKTTASKKSSGSSQTPVIETTIEEIRNFQKGDRVRFSGIVLVEPGILGSQFFYLGALTNSSPSGIQIYLYNRQFPALLTGDVVSVTGEISEAQGETRVKAKAGSDIQILEHNAPLTPMPIDIIQIDEAVEGVLVEVAGEITERSASGWYLDDGTEEIKVTLKASAGISKEGITLGDQITLTGIVSESNGAYRILPRSSEDIEKITERENEDKMPQVLGEKITSIPSLTRTYLITAAGGITAIALGLLGKSRGARDLAFIRRQIEKIRSRMKRK